MSPFRCLGMRPFWVPCRALLCKTPKGPGEQQASGFDGVWGGLVRGPESLRVRGGVTGSSTVSKELWDLVRPPHLWHIFSAPLPQPLPGFPFTSDQNSPWHHSASPGNDLVMPLWTRLGCALARLGWPKKKKVPERVGGLWSLQGGSAGRGTSASLS